jgi:hypothetical protein
MAFTLACSIHAKRCAVLMPSISKLSNAARGPPTGTRTIALDWSKGNSKQPDGWVIFLPGLRDLVTLTAFFALAATTASSKTLPRSVIASGNNRSSSSTCARVDTACNTMQRRKQKENHAQLHLNSIFR